MSLKADTSKKETCGDSGKNFGSHLRYDSTCVPNVACARPIFGLLLQDGVLFWLPLKPPSNHVFEPRTSAGHLSLDKTAAIRTDSEVNAAVIFFRVPTSLFLGFVFPVLVNPISRRQSPQNEQWHYIFDTLCVV